jgi:guanylate kinase
MKKSPISRGPLVGTSIIIVSAPSGSGKTSLVKRLLASDDRLQFSVSHTTRRPRVGEINGREYYFVSPARFKRMIAAGDFVEWANVFGHLYGTSWNQIRQAQASGRDVLLDVDVQGHRQMRRRLPEAVSIFILPPSYQELERRLRRRKSDAPEAIERRLAVARKEMRHWKEYDYLVVNDRLPGAVRSLRAIVTAARSRRQVQAKLVEKICTTFGGER